MTKNEDSVAVLKEFLSMPIDSGDAVFQKFLKIDGAKISTSGQKFERFLYIPGKRDDRVVLVAHADTYWDEQGKQQTIASEGEKIFGTNKDCGIGADDRAGCAILWLLKDSGHSILILDGEERSSIGAKYLLAEHRKIADEINNAQFMVQFDRKNNADCKYYSLPVSDDFKAYISKKTNFTEPDQLSSTDICHLCKKACGVNLSTAYYNEHHYDEYLNVSEWLEILAMLEGWLGKHGEKIPKFELVK